MTFLELAKNRYSVRKFKDDPVPQEKIDKILKAGHLAPTACNNQPQKIIVVNSAAGLEKFRKCTTCHFNEQLVFIVCFDRNLSWKRSYDGKDSGDIDAAIVATHMMLEAAEEGIGSTWIMHYIPEAVKEEFGLEDNIESTVVLSMGYAAEDAVPAKLHELYRDPSEIVRYE